MLKNVQENQLKLFMSKIRFLIHFKFSPNQDVKYFFHILQPFSKDAIYEVLIIVVTATVYVQDKHLKYHS